MGQKKKKPVPVSISASKVTKKPVFSARKQSGITGNSAISLAKNLAGGKPQALFASKYTRKIIRQHHTLLKRQAIIKTELEAARNGKKGVDVAALEKENAEIEKKIEENGGILEYQKASIAGQSSTRGGDTSKLLVEWLQESWKDEIESSKPFSLLEVGCLSADNECSRSGIFGPIERIDLNSQDPKKIKQQDFMERPLPKDKSADAERFDFISLSLVVNYVPDHFQRGEMLRRCAEFLKTPSNGHNSGSPFPGLFFVLPAPCVLNSRYMTEELLTSIMEELGFKLERRKESSKLVYWLYRLVRKNKPGRKVKTFKREEINPGAKRNNFSICLK